MIELLRTRKYLQDILNKIKLYNRNNNPIVFDSLSCSSTANKRKQVESQSIYLILLKKSQLYYYP